MGQTNINIRMDEDLKKEFNQFCEQVGLNMSTAFNLFARNVVNKQKIPFEISLDTPNAETLAAMQEIEDMKSGKIPKHPQSVESLFKELQINVDR